MRSSDRWDREVVRLGRAVGLAAREVETLRAGTRRLVLHLRPDDVVARVVPRAALGAASRELALATHLARAGAPVAPPLAAHAGPHVGPAVTVTLWAHLPATPPRECTDADRVAAYLALWRTDVARLTPGDRAHIEGELDIGLVRLRGWRWRLRAVALHGDPHAGNLVRTRSVRALKSADSSTPSCWTG